MYQINLEYYGDTAGLVVSYRGTTVKLYANEETHDRLLARAGGGGYDRAGTCLGEFLTNAFQPELQRIARRAYSQYRTNAAGDLQRVTSKHPRDALGGGGRDSLYGMTVYRDKKNRVAKVRLDGACGWESMVRIAEAIGLRVKYVAETKNTRVYLLTGLAKIQDRRVREDRKVTASLASNGTGSVRTS